MKSVKVAGLNITAETKTDLLILLRERLKSGTRTKIFTPYSEFLHAALENTEVMELLNSADVSLPDGIGILWAESFLRLKLPENKLLAYIALPLQALWVSLATLTYKAFLYKNIPSRISGSTFIWELASLCQDLNISIYLVGGFDQTPAIVKQKLELKMPRLKIVGTSNKTPAETEEVLAQINASNAQAVLVAFGPLRQEQWLSQNWDRMPKVLLGIGLGGTFDYIAGVKPEAPDFFRDHGLEWLYRFFTQPSRWERIFFGTTGLIFTLLRYKYRQYQDSHIDLQEKPKSA